MEVALPIADLTVSPTVPGKTGSRSRRGIRELITNERALRGRSGDVKQEDTKTERTHPASKSAATNVAGARVTLLDVGEQKYGDALLCQIAGLTVMIDGAHKGDDVRKAGHDSIPDQLRALTGVKSGAIALDLLIVTHMHDDHIGCLPELVANGVITSRNTLALDPKWRWQQAPAPAPQDAVSTGARQVALALGEEPRSPDLSDAELLTFLADAAGLEDRYTGMLEELDRQGRVFRYGTDDTVPLEQAFRAIGLQLLGPSTKQLEITQSAINGNTADVYRAVVDSLRVDTTTSVADLYRQAILARSGATDAEELMDGRGGPGSSINLQSIITLLRFDKRKALLTGDSQIAQPESQDQDLLSEIEALRRRIEVDAPYDFFKLPHHGSWNGFDPSVLTQLGDTAHFGICAGASSPAHPDPSVLELLAAHLPAIDWARTDRNRRSTYTFAQQIRLTVQTGRPNDSRPNTQDATVVTPEGRSSRGVVSAIRSPAAAPTVAGATPLVEVVTRISRAPIQVDLAIRVSETGAVSIAPAAPRGRRQDAGRTSALPELRIAGGRTLPRMLVVTCHENLVHNIGAGETATILDALSATPHVEVIDSLPSDVTDPRAAVAVVNQEVRRRADLEAVLILGGYDVVAAQKQDCLSPQLRQDVEAAIAAGVPRDFDDNIVWSDDVYAGGDPNDPLPHLPVSRIPDGGSGDLVVHALNAARALGPTRSGIRNVLRPFAEDIFALLPGSAAMGISAPLTYDIDPPFNISTWAYFMLHGSDGDGTRFWGDDPATHTQPPAFDIVLVRQPTAEAVFAGCCWGALTVREKASAMQRGRVPTRRGPQDSIALAYLNAGAVAFVGCTGSHFSPSNPPYNYAGGPMHRSYWHGRAQGLAPARALFEAKREYLRHIPHDQEGTMARASEYKTFYQFTCLGLGW